MTRPYLALLLCAFASPVWGQTSTHDGFLANGETCPTGRICHSWHGEGANADGSPKDMGPDHPVCWYYDGFGGYYFPCKNNGERVSSPGKKWTLRVERYGRNDQLSYGFSEADCKITMEKYPPVIGWSASGMENGFAGKTKYVECFQDGSQAQQ